MMKTSVSITRNSTGKLEPATLITGITIRQAELAQMKWQEP